MRVDDFDFVLPEDRIALRPVHPRDAARMLCVNPHARESIQDRGVRDLLEMLNPGDTLVFNDTRVIPAQLSGVRHRGDATANVSVTLIEPLDASRWKALARPAKRLRTDDRILFGKAENTCLQGMLWARVERRQEDGGEVTLAFDFHGSSLDEAIATLGKMPLPPYIASRRAPDSEDEEDYQTVYARERGAVAAPTAGLHFTEDLLRELREKGIEEHFVTLHVGAGTFLPVKVDDTRDHAMHSERCEITQATADELNRVRAQGGRVIAVGSTSVRVLESASDDSGWVAGFEGETDIFITPGYRFKVVDAMLTNFHLPRSTLFMLVSAFCGLETMKAAYSHAVASGYRFYSYGDACFLEPC